MKDAPKQVAERIRRQTPHHLAAEDMIRIVLEDLCGEDNIAELCQGEGIAPSLFHNIWLKAFKKASKRRLSAIRLTLRPETKS